MTSHRIGNDLQRVSLSNRQYAALRMFTDNPRRAVDPDSALLIDQRSFGSIFHQKWIKFDKARQGFVVTPLGIRAMSLYESTSVLKETPSVNFSHFITSVKNLTIYHNGHGAAA